MPQNFQQYLTIGLIILLFADKYIPAILQKYGFKVGKNGNGNGNTSSEEIHKELHELQQKIVEFGVKIDLLMKKL